MNNRTNELRKLINVMLSEEVFVKENDIKDVYFEVADDNALFPHIIFTFDNVNLDDLHRKDKSLVVDIYDKSDSAFRVEKIADEIEDMFNAKNLPQEHILPTFFLENRRAVPDEDKKIRHRQIEILVQNYEGE